MSSLDGYFRDVRMSAAQKLGYPRNAYGQPIIPPEYFDGIHSANPGPAGHLSVCSCGWTQWTDEASGVTFTMADHLTDMGEWAEGVAAQRER